MRSDKTPATPPDRTHKVLDVLASGALVFGVYVFVATLAAEANWGIAAVLTVAAAGVRYATRYLRVKSLTRPTGSRSRRGVQPDTPVLPAQTR